MKKLLCVLLTLCLTFSVCACSGADAPQPTDTPAPTETPVPEITPEPTPEPTPEVDPSAEELDTMLADFATSIQAGSAGSSMKAAVQAARLMDWAQETTLTDEEITQAAQGFISSMNEDALTDYLMQIEALDNAYLLLLTNGQEELLESAGVTDCGYPWGSEPMPAVEALMNALSQRNYIVFTDDGAAFADYSAVLEAYYNETVAAQTDPDNYTLSEDTLLNPNIQGFIMNGSLGYCYYDVNADGEPELLIGTTSPDYPTSWVFDMYTMVDGECVSVFQGWERNVYCIAADGTIGNTASASAFNYWYGFYDLVDGQLSRKLVLVYDAETNPDAPYYLESTEVDGQQSLSEDEFNAVLSGFEPYVVNFEYTPITELK